MDLFHLTIASNVVNPSKSKSFADVPFSHVDLPCSTIDGFLPTVAKTALTWSAHATIHHDGDLLMGRRCDNEKCLTATQPMRLAHLLEHFRNPSSIHSHGRLVRTAMKKVVVLGSSSGGTASLLGHDKCPISKSTPTGESAEVNP
jgi:hypothetical protein